MLGPQFAYFKDARFSFYRDIWNRVFHSFIYSYRFLSPTPGHNRSMQRLATMHTLYPSLGHFFFDFFLNFYKDITFAPRWYPFLFLSQCMCSKGNYSLPSICYPIVKYRLLMKSWSRSNSMQHTTVFHKKG